MVPEFVEKHAIQLPCVEIIAKKAVGGTMVAFQPWDRADSLAQDLRVELATWSHDVYGCRIQEPAGPARLDSAGDWTDISTQRQQLLGQIGKEYDATRAWMVAGLWTYELSSSCAMSMPLCGDQSVP